METTNIYHLIILDESGSMDSIKRAAISGCNETIQSVRSIQKKYVETQKHYVSLVSFNSTNSTKILIDKQPINKVEQFDGRQYNPDSCTPLYDAMGLSFTNLQNSIKQNKNMKSAVLATIITDGLENASVLFNVSKLKSLIDELSKCGWTFAYIGANQDVVEEAAKLNITNSLAFDTNDEDTRVMFQRVSEARASYSKSIARGDTFKMNNIFRKKR